jgi:hypothetical protein
MNLILFITNIMVEDILDDEFLDSFEREIPGFFGDGESLEQDDPT